MDGIRCLIGETEYRTAASVHCLDGKEFGHDFKEDCCMHTIAGLCTALIGAAVIPASSVEANSTNVIRLAGDTRYDTMSRIIQAEVPGTSEYVVVASGDNFPDALAAAPLAGALKAPIVLTSGNVLSPQAEQQITPLSK